MQTVFVDKETFIDCPTVATIGFFDGLHNGHRYLISRLIDVANKRKCRSMVVTFDRHPRQVLNADYQPELLTTLDEKLSLLSATGIDYCCVLHFTRDMAQLSALNFMKSILKQQLSVESLLMGYDNRFGNQRTATLGDYCSFGREVGIEIINADALVTDTDKISSSAVRRLISKGEVDKAATMLNRYHSVAGNVVHGHAIGRDLGFPTANIVPISHEQMMPPNGVYAVRVAIDNSETLYKGMMNIGKRPTFSGKETTFEVNIFDFSEDIYTKEIRVFFVKKLREELQFDSREALSRQLAIDRQQAIGC